MSDDPLWEMRMRPQGSPAELERRRLRAIDLLQREIPVHVVAERLGVDRRSVRRCKRAHRGQGRAGLRARPAPGQSPKLTTTQQRQLARLVVAGPEAAGYRTSLWIGRLIVSPRRRQLTLTLALYARLNIRGPQVLRFLRHLARHVRGPVVLVWDRGRSHKHHLVTAWLATHPRWHIVWFPPYAPELNPVELLWGYLKYGRLANLAPDTVAEIQGHVCRERRRLGRHPQLLRSFFRHSA